MISRNRDETEGLGYGYKKTEVQSNETARN